MLNFLTQVAHTINASIQVVDFSNNTTIDLIGESSIINNELTYSTPSFNNQEQIYYVRPHSETVYSVDKIIITRSQLSSIRVSDLSEFMQSEILQYQIGKWNNHSASTIKINFPLTDIKCQINGNTPCLNCKNLIENNNYSLDKLTFHLEGSETRKYNLKDYWPVNGTDLAIKAEEGIRIRRLLEIDQDQEITLLGLYQPTPNSSQTSLQSELQSTNSRISSLTTLFSQETIPNNFTVEAYHTYRHNLYLPLINEESSESLLLTENSSSDTLLSETSSTLTNRVTYTFPQNHELRNAILGMMSDIEREEITNSNFIPTRSNTEDTLVNNSNNLTRNNTANTLVENNSNNVILRSINNDSLTELTDQNRITSQLSERNSRELRRVSIFSNSNLGLHYRSHSPSSIVRSSSESLLTNASSDLSNDLD